MYIESQFSVPKEKCSFKTFITLASVIRNAEIGDVIETDEVPYIRLGCMTASLRNGLARNGIPWDSVDIKRPTHDQKGFMIPDRERPFLIKKVKNF